MVRYIYTNECYSLSLFLYCVRFQSTTAVYFRRADAFIIVYDVTNKLTFKSIKSWISLVKVSSLLDVLFVYHEYIFVITKS